MKIENVNQPQWSIVVTEKERRCLEDIFGSMNDVHLTNMMGDSRMSEFVLDFYKLVAYPYA